MTAKTDTKQDPRDLVLALLVGALLSPFVGMVRALTFRLLWDWFIAPQYGEGPTLQAWFGIGVLYTLISFRQGASKEELPRKIISRMFESALIGLLTLGVTIVAAAMARVIWGWR